MIRRGREPLLAFVATLGFGRATWVRFTEGEGLHRRNPRLLARAEEHGFGPRLCRPYRARTQGKVERFNGYLKGSFLVPPGATLKAAGLKLDSAAANAHIGRWLAEVADARIHGTTGEPPDRRLQIERAALMPLPRAVPMPRSTPRSERPVPISRSTSTAR